MLRKFAMALVATTLIAGSALAAQPSATSGTPAATRAAPAAKTNKIVAHATKHVRKHVARKAGKIHQARHVKSSKTRQAAVAKSAKHS
jgi:hypothetical protein